MSRLEFPEGFLWGASTSSYQIEGGNHAADWAMWEKNGRVNDEAHRAADSWERFREDVDLAVSLNLRVYRISTEWSRIEPHPGVFDEDAIARYAEWLAYAQERGLQTMVVLWHFTNPIWVTEAGSWEWSRAPERFEAYTRRVVPTIAPHVDWWATMNEVNTFARLGWVTGDWPPGKWMDYPGGFRVYARLAEGHRRARDAIRELVGAGTPVGLTHVVPWSHPAEHGGALSGPWVRFADWLGTTHFLDKVRGEFDWLGVQYYTDNPCRTFGPEDNDGSPPRTDVDWRIAPRGLYEVVMMCWKRYGVPILVTENGLADAADAQRARFLLDHLAWLRKAIEDGADVRGYLHWSLIDNYEWAYGYGPRFGLAEVDYETFERRVRPSGELYSRIARDNTLPGDLLSDLRYADGQGSLAPE